MTDEQTERAVVAQEKQATALEMIQTYLGLICKKYAGAAKTMNAETEEPEDTEEPTPKKTTTKKPAAKKTTRGKKKPAAKVEIIDEDEDEDDGLSDDAEPVDFDDVRQAAKLYKEAHGSIKDILVELGVTKITDVEED